MSWGIAIALACAALVLARILWRHGPAGFTVRPESPALGAIPPQVRSDPAPPLRHGPRIRLAVQISVVGTLAFLGGGADTLAAAGLAAAVCSAFSRLDGRQPALLGGSSLLLVAATAAVVESLQPPGAGLRMTPLYGLLAGCALACCLRHRAARADPPVDAVACRPAMADALARSARAIHPSDLLGLQVLALVASMAAGNRRMPDFSNALSYPLMLAAVVLLCTQTVAWRGASGARAAIASGVSAIVLWPVSLWQMIGNHGRTDGSSFAIHRLWACSLLGLLLATLWGHPRWRGRAGAWLAQGLAGVALCLLLAGTYGLMIALLAGVFLFPAVNSSRPPGSA